MHHSVTVDLGDRQITLESGKLAKQANGSVVVRCGDTVVLATACASTSPRVGIDFFPLTVDYREYYYSMGKIPGGFIKREGRPSEKEVLTSRQIDRPIRPLFPPTFRNETQVMAMVMSADPEFDPDTLAIFGAGAALAISDIPFHEVISAVRVGKVDGQLVVNPSYEELRDSTLNITVAGTDAGIVMVESGAKEVSEDDVVDAIDFGHEACRKLNAAIRELVAKVGKPKQDVPEAPKDEALAKQIDDLIHDELKDALNTEKYPKLESYARVAAAKEKAVAIVPEDDADRRSLAGKIFNELKEKIFREQILDDKRRPDGRAFDTLRNVEAEVGLLPRVHGTGLFTRGETQALVSATLGSKEDEQRMEALDAAVTSKRFMLHYNFPPFSVGEVGFLRGPGRREIGHGALAERAVAAVLPPEEDFPYTMRVVSDILESNGSSSMASVCGASLSLMDAGCPLKAPVAGIAMGLVTDGDRYAVLTDIAGAEDHYGDMDFKVAGTAEGITALQMDIKVPNVTTAIMREALQQAKTARLQILDVMTKAIDTPRTEISDHAPRIYTTTIPTDKIRELIGPGGKVIRGIVDATGVKIDVNDDGIVNVFASDGERARQALAMIADIMAVAEVGKTYLGKVVRIAEFGAFVEIFPGTDGLLHISEIAETRIKSVRDELNEGDQILVKVLALEGNRIKLSRKAVLKEQREKLAAAEE
jgi:polyribonucleotide nucleotidyltransferase